MLSFGRSPFREVEAAVRLRLGSSLSVVSQLPDDIFVQIWDDTAKVCGRFEYVGLFNDRPDAIKRELKIMELIPACDL